MKKEDLIPIIARQDPLLANAVSHMIDYIQDRWAAPYPILLFTIRQRINSPPLCTSICRYIYRFAV